MAKQVLKAMLRITLDSGGRWLLPPVPLGETKMQGLGGVRTQRLRGVAVELWLRRLRAVHSSSGAGTSGAWRMSPIRVGLIPQRKDHPAPLH